MRVIVPDDISKLVDVFAPFLAFDNERMEYTLKENAPEDVVEAQRKYHEWFDGIKEKNS